MKRTIVLLLALAFSLLSLASTGPALAVPVGQTGPAESESVFDLNSVGYEDLITIRGIGPALAKRILDYRAKQGSFDSVEELLEVKGIGTKNLVRFSKYFSLAAPPSPVATTAPNPHP